MKGIILAGGSGTGWNLLLKEFQNNCYQYMINP